MKNTRPCFPSPLVGEGAVPKARRMRGIYPRRQTPHPSRRRFAAIADAKDRRPTLRTAAGAACATFSHRGRRKKKGPGRNRGLMSQRDSERLLIAVLERGAENVAQRCSRIGGAVLRDGFLLFGN